MANKLDFGTKEGLDKWFDGFSKDHRLSRACTYSDSLMTQVVNLISEEDQMRRLISKGERDALYAQAMCASTKWAAPIYECAWASCAGMVERGLTWFTKNENDATYKLWDSTYPSLRREPPTLEALHSYQESARKWRQDVGFAINENTSVLTESVQLDYALSPRIICNVRQMLGDILRRRSLRQGAAPSRGTVRTDTVAAQIDTVFSSYYWAFKAGVTPVTFPALSQFLFDLGTIPRGNSRVRNVLYRAPWTWGIRLLSLFADDTFLGERIHMHPGVLTLERLSEMGAAFGAFPVVDPSRVDEGSGFPKYILNMKVDGSNPCATTISELFYLQKIMTPMYEEEDIIMSENLLYQSLADKRSLFQHAGLLTGRAAEIRIVASYM